MWRRVPLLEFTAFHPEDCSFQTQSEEQGEAQLADPLA